MNKLAHETGFRKRNGGKITPFTFLRLSCQKALDGSCSIRNYTVTLSAILTESISKQAVWKRISPMATAFFVAVLQTLIGREVNACKVIAKELLAFFPRILLQDSTVIALHKSLFKYFPGSSNQNGSTSSAKIQVVYNLLNSTFVYFKLTSFRENDQKAASELDFLKKGDLLIRDLGYFSIKVFRKICEEYEAFFLSRLRYGVNILDLDSHKPINLLRFLTGKHTIDINVLLGKSDKLPVRLVGEKVPEDVANKRRRELKQNRNQNYNPSKEHLELLGWSLYITNIPQEMWGIKTILLLYSLRWRIEIIFKSWKSCLNFDIKHRMSNQQVNLLIYSRLIIVTLFTAEYYPQFEAKVFNRSKRHLSLLKFLDIFMTDTEMICLLLEYENPGKQDLLITILIKHATYEKRQRLNYSQMVMKLNECKYGA